MRKLLLTGVVLVGVTMPAGAAAADPDGSRRGQLVQGQDAHRRAALHGHVALRRRQEAQRHGHERA